MSSTLLTQPSVATSDQPRTRQRLPLSWSTVAVCALVIAYADGFLVTSLQGTIGAIERNQPPFMRWARDSTLMLPLFVLAVWAALALTRRWIGSNRRELVSLSAAAVLIIGITTAISVVEVTASSAYDYHLQLRQLEQKFAGHVHSISTPSAAVASSTPTACTGHCAAQHSTLMVHVRAVSRAGVLLLITNLVLVGWVLALRGGRLWRRWEMTVPAVTVT
jgi:hypothetical protein